MEPTSPASPTLQADSLSLSHQGSPALVRYFQKHKPVPFENKLIIKCLSVNKLDISWGLKLRAFVSYAERKFWGWAAPWMTLTGHLVRGTLTEKVGRAARKCIHDRGTTLVSMTRSSRVSQRLWITGWPFLHAALLQYLLSQNKETELKHRGKKIANKFF